MAEYYDRERLYKEVWEAPMRDVCKRYAISDVGLVKVCKKLRIATPPRGYWAKKSVGKAPNKPRLIKYDNTPNIPIRQIEDPEPRLAPVAFEEADSLIQNITDMTLSDDLENLHPYVRNTRKLFRRRLQKGWLDDYNRISVSGDDVFDINIGQDSLDRASLILQTLCTATLSNGFEIVLHDKYGVCFQIMDEYIPIRISESTKKVPISDKEKDPYQFYYHDYKFIPTGILKLEINTDSFSMDERKSWTDSKNKRIEDKLVDVMHRIIRAAAWKKEYAAFHKKREEEWQIEKEKQIEKDRLARIEKRRISDLESGFKKWLYHKEMTEYVSEVRTHYMAKDGEPEGDFAQWVAWAESYLGKINPLNGECPKYDIGEDNHWIF